MKKTKKALASLAIAGMVLSMAPMSVFGATTTDRIFGADRIETAVKVAQAGWTTAATVIVAPAADANLVDALAAAPLAGQEKAPILLTDGAALDAKTKQAIVDLKATKVYAVGALSEQVVADLQGISGVTVEALKGADRIETATKIVAKLTAPAGSFVVGYGALADALSVASFAAANNYSILVANPDGTLPASETAVGTKYVIGGPTLVADVAGAERVYGADRFATNKAVLNKLTYEYGKVYVANGEQGHLVDSLVASSLAANDKAAIVLGDMTSAAAAADVSAKLAADSQVVALGGTSVVPDAVKNSVKYAVPGTLAVESVSAINPIQIEVKFNKAVDEDSATDPANYFIDGVALSDAAYGLTSDDIELDDNNEVVTITLATADGFENGTAYAVKVSKNVLDADLAKGADYTTSFLFNDKSAPVVDKVTATASDDTRKVKVYFNEPVAGSGVYKINGTVATVASGADTDTLTLTAGSDLKAGSTYTLVIANEEDLAQDANALEEPVSKSFTVTTDTNAPTVESITQLSSNKVRVVFNEKLSGFSAADVTVIKGAATYTDPDISVSNNLDVDDSGKTWDLTLGFTVYESDKDTQALTFYFEDASFEDQYGNEFDGDYTKTLTLSKDEAGPVVESIKASSDKKLLKVTFSEDLSAADDAKILVTDADGYRYTVQSAVVDADADVLNIDITAGDVAMEDGTYTVKLNAGAVTDQFSNDNETVTKTVVVNAAGDTEEPTATITSAGTNSFEVDFGEEVTAATALKYSNYLLDGTVIPSDSDIYFLDADHTTVQIDLQKGSVNSSAIAGTFTVKNVTDLAGNKIDTTSVAGLAIADNTAAVLESVQVIGNDIFLTFDSTIKASTATAIDTVAELNANFEIKVGTKVLNLGTDDSTATGGSDAAVTVSLVAGNSKKVKISLTPAVIGTGGVVAGDGVPSNWDSSKTITVKTKDTATLQDANSCVIDDEVTVNN